jgi:hypothetical protein
MIAKILKNRLIKWGFIPLILLLFWMGMSLYYIRSEPGLNILLSKHSKNNLIKFNINKILSQEKRVGQFKAEYNYLGIVAVRFNTFSKINDDYLLFRIKEKGSNKWYYENKYKVDQFQNNQLFPFGFPVISDSMGKTYVFEIESLYGESKNAVAISSIEPVFVTKYQYPRTEIVGNITKALFFFKTKLINSISNKDFLISSIVYLLPLISYILYQLYFQKYLSNRYYLVLIPVFLLTLESFLVNNTNDLLVIILTLLTAAVFLSYKIESSVTMSFVLLFLIAAPIMFFIGEKQIAENFSMWAYMLLWIGLIQMLWEVKKGKKDLIDYRLFWKRLWNIISYLKES